MRRAACAALLMACASAPAKPSAPAAGSRVERPEFVAELRAGPEAQVGQPLVAIVELEARSGFHVNGDYPIHFDGPTRLDRQSFQVDQHHARAPVPVTIEKAGPVRVAGVLAFSVCDANRCLIDKIPLEVSVTAR